MKRKQSLSSIKRIFFTPIDQEQLQLNRDQQERKMLEMNIQNIR